MAGRNAPARQRDGPDRPWTVASGPSLLYVLVRIRRVGGSKSLSGHMRAGTVLEGRSNKAVSLAVETRTRRDTQEGRTATPTQSLIRAIVSQVLVSY